VSPMIRTVPAAAILALPLWGRAPAAAPDTEPFARYSVHGTDVCFGRDGSLRIVRGENVLVSGSNVVIAAPGWRSSVSQKQVQPAEGYPRREGDRVVWRGTIPDRRQGLVWRFDQRAEPTADGVLLSYAVTPSRDTTIGEACVFIDLPASYWRGKPVLLHPTTAGSFPVKLGGPRHFLTGTALRAVLGDRENGRLCLEFGRVTQCTVQDIRRPNLDLFQIYPRISLGGKLAAGKTYRLDVTIVPNDSRPHAPPTIEIAARGTPAIRSVRLSADAVPRFGHIEVTCEATGTWDNPFDPNQVMLDAHVTDPTGRRIVVPGFFFQDYRQVGPPGGELLVPKGAPTWRIRYTPVVPGLHRIELVLQNSGRKVRSGPFRFVCTKATAGHGFVRVSQTNPHYFEYTDGAPFFAIGANVALIRGGDLTGTLAVYRKMAEAGVNLVRSWWCFGASDLGSWHTGRGGEGFGKIRLDNAWRIDRLVTESEQLGLHLMCCLETQQNLRRDKTWSRFTYNKVNGGPLSRPREFFTDAAARAAFRARLRYIVARWGYSTAVFSWQFWNEVNACNEFQVNPVAAWHRDMARYLRSIDPWRHIIHTNFGNLDGYPQVDGLPDMEIVSTNSYSRRDMGRTACWAGRCMTREYGKPYLLTEYGVGHHGGWIREDPEGIILHNGLWGSLVSGSAGTAMPWGCYNWIDPQGLYRYWRPVAEFVKGVPFHCRKWRPVQAASFRFADKNRKPYYAGVFFEGWPRNYAYTLCKTTPDTYHITDEGNVLEQKSLRGVLRSDEQQRFVLTCPVAGQFVVHVPEISSQGAPVLHVAIDGNVVISESLKPGKAGPWSFWRAFAAPIGKGRHTIVVCNAGTGALWTGFELTRFRLREGPDLDVYGIQCEDVIFLWLRQPQWIWIYRREGRKAPPQPAGLLTLSHVSDGTYRVRWLDTRTGQDLGGADLTAAHGMLVLPTPSSIVSAAAKIEKIGR